MSEELELEPDSSLDAEPAAPTPKSKASTWAIAGAASLALGVGAIVGVEAFAKDGGATPLSAQPSGQSVSGAPTMVRFGNAGKITKIDGDSFTLQSENFNGETETVTVATDDDTTFTDVVEGTRASLKVGQEIVATGTTTDGVLSADRIAPSDLNRRRATADGDGPPRASANGEMRVLDGPPPDGAPRQGEAFEVGSGSFVGGEITAINGDTITIKDIGGETKTVKVTDTTKVMVNRTITLSDLDVGDDVRVGGETKNNVLQAESVTRGDLMGGGPGMVRRGPMTQQNGAESSAP